MAATAQAQSVELIVLIGCGLMGLSHLIRPQLWRDYFATLAESGAAGMLQKLMLFEFWPAVLIVAFHPVWSGLGAVVTVFGWLLLVKVCVGLLVPSLALRSMRTPESAPRSFLPAGVALIVVSGCAGAALLWPG